MDNYIMLCIRVHSDPKRFCGIFQNKMMFSIDEWLLKHLMGYI